MGSHGGYCSRPKVQLLPATTCSMVMERGDSVAQLTLMILLALLSPPCQAWETWRTWRREDSWRVERWSPGQTPVSLQSKHTTVQARPSQGTRLSERIVGVGTAGSLVVGGTVSSR